MSTSGKGPVTIRNPNSTTTTTRPQFLLAMALVIGLILMLSDDERVGTLAGSRGGPLSASLSATLSGGDGTSGATTTTTNPLTAAAEPPSPQRPPVVVGGRCDCREGSRHFVVVSPCAGLVNQHYAIAHAALIAGGIGADVVIEDMSTRSSFLDSSPLYVENKRLPTSAFHDLPQNVEGGRFTVALYDALPPEIAGCKLFDDSHYRRHVKLDSLIVMANMVDQTCGIRVGCSFYGAVPSNDNERMFIVDVLRALIPSPRLRSLGDAIIARLRAPPDPGDPAADGGAAPWGSYTAVHLRLEPDMNGGKILPVPRGDVERELNRLGVAPNSAIYVASGVAKEIFNQLPEGYRWYHRDQLLELARAAGGPELQAPLSVEGLAAEQIALVDLWVCRHAEVFIGDVRSTFSVAAAVLKDMQGVGWYFGSLSMWAKDAIKLGLPAQESNDD
jgi:hypothetical protein